MRVLASILRFVSTRSGPAPKQAKQAILPAPSSNVDAGSDGKLGDHEQRDTRRVPDARGAEPTVMHKLVQAARRRGLGGALTSFLPPAREEGQGGVTRDSVAARPDWSAPIPVTANTCGCLLHLMEDEDAGIVEQVG